MKPTLSPSKLTTYLACPVKYRWTYLDRRGRLYARSKSYYSFGTSLHRALQHFHERGGIDTTGQVVAWLEEDWISAGYSDPEEMAEALHEGVTMLERHVEQERRRESRATALCVERRFSLDLGEFTLVGQVDRVDEHEDGTLEIIDYKSGRETVTPEDVADDIAMGCYQLLVAHAYPDRRIVATIQALRTGNQASASMDPEERERFAEDIRSLGGLILAEMEEHYDLVPRPKRLCATCDYLALCRRHEEFAEAWQEFSKAE